MLIAEDVQVEWDEGGCYLLVDGERWRVADPEQLYDRVKAAILPWLMERDEARGTFRPRVFTCVPDESAGAYELTDTKHPTYHERMADAFDVFNAEDR